MVISHLGLQSHQTVLTDHIEVTYAYLVATQCYAKWVKEVALKRSNGTTMANSFEIVALADLASPSAFFLIMVRYLSILMCE